MLFFPHPKKSIFLEDKFLTYISKYTLILIINLSVEIKLAFYFAKDWREQEEEDVSFGFRKILLEKNLTIIPFI